MSCISAADSSRTRSFILRLAAQGRSTSNPNLAASLEIIAITGRDRVSRGVFKFQQITEISNDLADDTGDRPFDFAPPFADDVAGGTSTRSRKVRASVETRLRPNSWGFFRHPSRRRARRGHALSVGQHTGDFFFLTGVERERLSGGYGPTLFDGGQIRQRISGTVTRLQDGLRRRRDRSAVAMNQNR